jgi:hypothetical protein
MGKGKLDYKASYRRHLPHFQPPGATLFVTSRLAGSIPVETQKQLNAEAAKVEATLAGIADPQQRAQRAYLEHRRLFGQWDAALHNTAMQAIKGRSAYQANPLLNRRGTFWQHENYDHVVRDEAEWRRIIL